MSLIEKYESLVSHQDSFTGYRVDKLSTDVDLRFGIDNNARLVLIIPTSEVPNANSVISYRFEYIELSHNNILTGIDNDEGVSDSFSILKLLSDDEELKLAFISLCEVIIEEIGASENADYFNELIMRFVKLFKQIDSSSDISVQGLWGELFQIYIASDSSTLIEYWHKRHKEKYDFNSGVQKIEVKSTLAAKRVHLFSSEQLETSDNSELIISSVLMKKDRVGLTIGELVELIKEQIPLDNASLFKDLQSVVIQTIGAEYERACNASFDLDYSIRNHAYYWAEDVKKIERQVIPSEVSQVRFQSDLSGILPIGEEEIISLSGNLFNAL